MKDLDLLMCDIPILLLNRFSNSHTNSLKKPNDHKNHTSQENPELTSKRNFSYFRYLSRAPPSRILDKVLTNRRAAAGDKTKQY
ncbi:MAG: hypothetical protein AB1611_18350 [bacterium]